MFFYFFFWNIPCYKNKYNRIILHFGVTEIIHKFYIYYIYICECFFQFIQGL